MKCSYCKTTEMTVISERVKRPVPQGATDLGFYDDAILWKCPQCGQTQVVDDMRPCPRCRNISASSSIAHLPFVPVIIQLRGWQGYSNGGVWACTACTPCDSCKKMLVGQEWESIVSDKPSYEGDATREWSVHHFHKVCAAKRNEEIKIEVRRAEEASRQQKRQAEELLAERRSQGLCVKCGKRLGLFTKRSTSRDAHHQC